MNIQIHDSMALREVSPQALSAFAKASGWSIVEAFGAHSDIYSGEGRPEIILPRTATLGDYPSIVSRLLNIFSTIFDRDALSIFRDLIGAEHDVVRVRASGGDESGSIDLESGVRIISNARDMLLAAACSIRNTQAVFRSGANREATDFLNRVRLGQTERGSYIVTMMAPVDPQLQQNLFEPQWPLLGDEPIGRQVTRRLADALVACRTASEQAVRGNDRAFDDAVQFGVSANLCEAVAGLIDNSGGLDISLTWAKTRPTPELRREIVFSTDEAATLREAARLFKARLPIENQTIFGPVIKLNRRPDQTDGEVTIQALVEGQLQSVAATLNETNYNIASGANVDRDTVTATGDLIRVGQRWRIQNAQVVRYVAEDVSEGGIEQSDVIE